MGGTDADKLFYDFSESPTNTPPPGYKFVLNATQFDAMFDFATSVNFSIVFGLNGGPGPRNNTKGGAWDSSNARLVLTRAVDNKYPLSAIELSNEPNLFFVNYGPGHIVTAKQLAQDYHHLRATADEVTNTATGAEDATPLTIAGPDVAYQLPLVGEGFPFMPNFLEAVGAGVIDRVTWHGYLLQSKYCPLWYIDPEFATVRKAMSPHTLDRMAKLSDEVSASISKANITSSAASASNTKPALWLGETSMVSCGGTPGISDAFADSFWWADTLGNMAKHGNEMVMRQTLAGGPY
jgi:heparanase 1